MKALVFERSLPRFAASRVGLGDRRGRTWRRRRPARAARGRPARSPRPVWVRLRPRSGGHLRLRHSDTRRPFAPVTSSRSSASRSSLATRSSADAAGGAFDGRRVVVEAVLGCEARGIDPTLRSLQSGPKGRLRANSFRGSWLPAFRPGIALTRAAAGRRASSPTRANCTRRPSELLRRSGCDGRAGRLRHPCRLLVEAPERRQRRRARRRHARAVHDRSAAAFCLPGTLVAVAKHPDQRRLASDLGADQVVAPAEVLRAARRL